MYSSIGESIREPSIAAAIGERIRLYHRLEDIDNCQQNSWC